MTKRKNVLIAGIGGASLGIEILKCLVLAKRYNIFGCDISEFAYGHYQNEFKKTFLVDREKYIDNILGLCLEYNISYIIPGGEEPMVLLGKKIEVFKAKGIEIVGNSQKIINNFSNKEKTFKILSSNGFQVPLTIAPSNHEELNKMKFPCVIKPSTGSGGSVFVFLAKNLKEAKLYLDYLTKLGKSVIAQEYISHNEGEFTVGVLSSKKQEIIGSIVLKRLFHTKLSVLLKSEIGLLSTGYSQGLIDRFPLVQETCEEIAKSIGSEGPLNIQGRIKDNKFIPFEINPRFSASTYLRALANFNEIDIYLNYLITNIFSEKINIKPGYYLRSFSEKFIEKNNVKK